MLTFLIEGAFKAALASFFELVYFVGCILIVVMSPKICKGIFAGSCGLGALIGGALTAVTAAAMGLGRVGVATGAFGSGKIGQIASTVFDGSSRGGRATKVDPAPDPPGPDSTAGGSRPASMEAILATGTPAAKHPQAFGGVSGSLARVKLKSQIPKVQTPKKTDE